MISSDKVRRLLYDMLWHPATNVEEYHLPFTQWCQLLLEETFNYSIDLWLHELLKVLRNKLLSFSSNMDRNSICGPLNLLRLVITTVLLPLELHSGIIKKNVPVPYEYFIELNKAK